MPNKKTSTLPEARQCVDPDNPFYGAVAVKTSHPDYEWFVGHPQHGGSWIANDVPVKDWPTLEPQPAAVTS